MFLWFVKTKYSAEPLSHIHSFQCMSWSMLPEHREACSFRQSSSTIHFKFYSRIQSLLGNYLLEKQTPNFLATSLLQHWEPKQFETRSCRMSWFRFKLSPSLRERSGGQSWTSGRDWSRGATHTLSSGWPCCQKRGQQEETVHWEWARKGVCSSLVLFCFLAFLQPCYFCHGTFWRWVQNLFFLTLWVSSTCPRDGKTD